MVNDIDWKVRHAIYAYFARSAAAPSMKEVALAAGLSEDDTREAVARLADAHVITLAPGSQNIWMAHPFSAVPTAYPVRIGELRYWANCAWDAFGITVLIKKASAVATQCANSCTSITLELSPEGPKPSEAVIHFLVPPRRFWDNIGYT